MAGIECAGGGDDWASITEEGAGGEGGRGESGGGSDATVGGTGPPLLVEGNGISRHTGHGGAGLVVRAGGAGTWRGNTIRQNALGVRLAAGALALLDDNEVCENTRAGVQIDAGAAGVLRDNRIHRNGGGRVASNGRRGERTHGDDA
eukprot:6277911-Prymnesium_polylepis.2